MPTSYTSLIGLALPVTGELSGTWGDVVNNYITNYLDSAVAGTQTISGSQTAVTLSVTNGSSLVTAGSGATGSAQFQIINCTGNPAGLLTITAPASSRQYIIINATSTSQSVKIVGTGPTTGVTLIAGEKAHVAWNGSDFVKIATTAAAGGSNTQVQYNSSGVLAGSSNLTFDGTNLTVGGTASATKLIPTGGAATGNGMYLPAANTLAWSNNGSETMRLDSSGNLGLGATPAYRLDVSGGHARIRGAQALFWGNSDNTNFVSIYNGGSSGASTGQMIFETNGTEKMRLDSSGNLGIGVTPSAWSGGNGVIEFVRGGHISNEGGSTLYIGNNFYYNGTNYIYKTTQGASVYGVGQGSHVWYNAPSGTANTTTITNGVSYTIITSGNQTAFGAANNNVGTVFTATSSGTLSSGTVSQNISFTQAMTLDANGNLGVGITSPSTSTSNARGLVVGGGVDGQIRIQTTNTGTTSSDGLLLSLDSSANAIAYIWNYENASMLFGTNNTERMRLDSSGNLLLGTTTSAYSTAGRGLIEVNGSSTALYALKIGNTAYGYLAASSSITELAANGASQPLVFTTNAAERARIDSSGNLLVGTTTALAKLTAFASSGDIFSSKTSGTSTGFVYSSDSTTTSDAAFFIKNGAGVGSIQCTSTTTAYITTSDYRAKNTVAPITGALAKVAALKPVTYKWNADGSDGEGFIAHELAEVFPQAVSGTKDAVNADGTPKYQGIDTSFLVATLTAAIQEQQALIQSLTARIAALESKGA